MSPLNAYIDNLNLRRRLFQDPDISLPEDADTVRRALECDLSPENLHRDGEASASDVTSRRRFFTDALSELDTLATSAA